MGRLAAVEIIPVENCIEGEKIAALRLPAPEGAQGEHYYVAFAEGYVGDQGPVYESFGTCECA